ncbi:MAG: LuxR C-terminal-related transcriptional regulator [Anaerolineae bacterium]|nr:LuxR C-terminal-related transcriptional regulator [Anaerolineae bacterium]
MLSSTFVQTKLHAPPLRSGILQRSKLLFRLDEGLSPGVRIILVSAPAGFGKSTLLSAWAAHINLPLAWLSLDAEDNDVSRFLTYLIGALQSLRADIGQDALGLLKGGPGIPPAAVVASLVNDLSVLQGQHILVLDDFQVITSTAVAQALAYWLEHLPESIRLVIASRADPVLPLPRLRAGGQMVELRADDLRFSLDETADFLGRFMQVNLPQSDVAVLAARTEGWAAGLQMAALSLRGRQDGSEFIRAFSGNNRFILDYLTEEVFNRSSEQTRAFLLVTAITDRFCPALCEALLADEIKPLTAQAMLTELEQANLFLIPLDENGLWYRYHHLMLDLLRMRLKQNEPARLAELHRRAAGWFADQLAEKWDSLLAAEALRHALAGGDLTLAERLMEKSWDGWAYAGEINTALRWLKAMPEEQRNHNPYLSGLLAWSYYLSGFSSEAYAPLDQAERAMQLRLEKGLFTPDSVEHRNILSLILALRALLARLSGDVSTSLTLAQQAVNITPPENLFMLSIAYTSWGNALRESGDYRAALPVYEKSIEMLLRVRNMLALGSMALYYLRMLAAQGQLRPALESGKSLLVRVEAAGLSQSPGLSYIMAGVGELYYETGQLTEAENYARRGIHLARRGGILDAIKQNSILLARVLLVRDEKTQALEVLTAVDQEIIAAGGTLTRVDIRAWLARINLALGRLTPVADWSSAASLWKNNPPSGDAFSQLEINLEVRRCLAIGKKADALRLLDPLPELYTHLGRRAWEVEVLFLRALASLNPAAARADLQRALHIAAEIGLNRSLLDEGRPMFDLLSGAMPSLDETARIYAQTIMALMPLQPVNAAPVGMVEALSERELEVLRLMAAGLTNQQIAGQLVVATGTVKTHTANIYRKLESANRTQAVTRARELGLLSS